MRKVKEINIKSAYHYFEDMVNIKVFHSNLLNIEKKSHKNIYIYYIGYIMIKKFDDYENIHSVNSLYLIILLLDILKKTMVKNTYFLIQQKCMKKFFLELYHKLKHLREEKNYFMKKLFKNRKQYRR